MPLDERCHNVWVKNCEFESTQSLNFAAAGLKRLDFAAWCCVVVLTIDIPHREIRRLHYTFPIGTAHI